MHKTLTLLGFAQKAGQLQSGTANVEAMIEQKKAKLCIVAEDVSANVQKKWHMAAAKAKIPCYDFSSKARLGQAIGQSPRSIVCVTEERMAAAIEDALT